MLPDMTFVRAHGLDKHIAEAVEGALRATGRKREDIAKIVLYGPDACTHAALVKQLLTDCDPAAVTFEQPVELCFRRIHAGEGSSTTSGSLGRREVTDLVAPP